MNKKYNKFSIKVLFYIIVITVVLCFSCSFLKEKPVLIEKTDFLLDTSVSVKFYIKDKAKGKELIEKVFAEGKRLEHNLDPLKGDGELHQINLSQSMKSWKISPDLSCILNRSLYFYKKTGGSFDPTVAQVLWMWDFENGIIPGKNLIAEQLKNVGFEKLKISGDSLTFLNPGVKLDLGGAVPGYVADVIVSILKKAGVESGLVDAGGEIYAFGKKTGNKDWIIGFRHPRADETIILKKVYLPAVSTSGDYERFFIKDGIRYHHILDPKTGYPAKGCASVTVWAENVLDADILSTALFVLGPEKGLKLAEEMDNIEALFFFEKNGVLMKSMTTGVKDVLKN